MNNQPPRPPLHDLEAQQGYLDGLAGAPEPDTLRGASYLRGWHNGDAERGQRVERPQAEAVRLLAEVRDNTAALHRRAGGVLAGLKFIPENGDGPGVRLAAEHSGSVEPAGASQA